MANNKQILSEKELDVLTGSMIVFISAIERIMSLIECHYKVVYEDDKNYKQLVKKIGPVKAQQFLSETVRNQLTQNETLQLGRWLKEVKMLHSMTEKITDAGIKEARGDKHFNEIESTECLMNDYNLAVRIFLTLGNIKKDRLVQFEELCNHLSTEKIIPENLINKFKPIF